MQARNNPWNNQGSPVSGFFLAAMIVSLILGFSTASPQAFESLESRVKDRDPPLEILSEGGTNGGSYTVGVVLSLDPGSITYWRTPGEAGVPPVFSFDHSVNLATATVLYPAPERIEEEGMQVYGYSHSLVIPVQITPKNAREAVHLAIHLDYAICDRLCQPRKASAEIELSPDQPAAKDSRLAAAMTLVPERLAAEILPKVVKIIPVVGYEHPTWRLQWLKGPARDLFVEAPEGWFFTSKPVQEPNAFLVTAVEAPKSGDQPAAVPVLTMTLTTPDARQSYEFSLQPPMPARAEPFSNPSQKKG